MEKEGYFLYEAGILRGNDQCDLSLLKSFVLIVTGIIYMSGKRKLNPLELSDKFVKKLDNDEKLQKFTVKMGLVTFIVGVVQGITSFSLFRGHSLILYVIALGFTIFSICSVLFKLKGKVNSFSLIKLVFYLLIFIILLLNSSRVLFF